MAPYLPNRKEILSVAERAHLRNTLASARGIAARQDQAAAERLGRARRPHGAGHRLDGIQRHLRDWPTERPENVAYDHFYREFVFRQPANEGELGAIMSAESEEVFGCYRFDGLARWTSRSVGAWMEDMDVVLGYVGHVLSTETDAEIVDGLKRYAAYLTNSEFKDYVGDFRRSLDAARRRGR